MTVARNAGKYVSSMSWRDAVTSTVWRVDSGPLHRVMLRRRDGLEIFRIVALKAGDKRNAHARRQKWIFAVRFLAAAPARIAEDVDIGRPDGEAAIPIRRAIGLHRSGVLGAKLGADHIGDVVD